MSTFGARGAKHGTRSGFVRHHQLHEEPCDPCKVANRAYSNRYYREARRFVEGIPHVPAAKVRTHVRALRAQGTSVALIASTAGVSVSTVRDIDRRRKGVRPQTARRLLEVRPATFWKPAAPLQRRTRALARLGWSAEDIAAAAGLRKGTVADINSGATGRVFPSTDEGIRRAYEALSMRLGPSDRSRRRAEAQGWPPPLAWDDIDADPEPARTEGKVTVAEEAEWLARFGVGFEDAAHRLGYANPEYLQRTLTRAGRSDLVTQLKAQRRIA